MAVSAIGADVDKPLYIHRDFATQRTLYLIIVLDKVSKLNNIFLGQLIYPSVRTHTGLVKNLFSGCQPYPKNIGQGYFDSFATRQFHTSYTGQFNLLVIATDHVLYPCLCL